MKRLATLAAVLAAIIASPAMAQDAERESLPPDALALIEHFGMEVIPHEGPWFLQTHKSDEVIEGPVAERYPSERYAYTAIVAIMTRSDFSAMHRLRTDELWHFYGGDPTEILLLYPDGSGEVKIWGGDVLAGQEPQIMVHAGTWMGARPMGDDATAYSFGAMTLAPGFEYEDYEAGYREELVALYPEFADRITELTREDSLVRPAGEGAPPALVEPITVENLVGLEAEQYSEAISVARFTMQPSTAMPSMNTREGHEVMIVSAGKGEVRVGDETQAVSRGSVVYLPPQVPHAIRAESELVFDVAVTPAWRQEDVEILED